MACNECVRLLEDYNRQTRAHERSLDEYRSQLMEGLADAIESSSRRVQEAHTNVIDSRLAYQKHKASHTA